MYKYSGYITSMPDGYYPADCLFGLVSPTAFSPFNTTGPQDPLIHTQSHRLYSHKFMSSASNADQFLTTALVNKDLFI